MARDYVLHSFRREGEARIDYAAELNPQQHAAATAPPGPALVLAGAGSGKTRTLTYRVAFLIEHGIPAENILLLTFTNKAAREMMRRVTDLLGAELHALWGGTFHSIGARVLRIHAEALGYRPDFTILDRDDSEALVKACLGALPESEGTGLLPKPEALLDLFSRAANERRSLAQVIEKYTSGHLPVDIDFPLAELIERARSCSPKERSITVRQGRWVLRDMGFGRTWWLRGRWG